MTGLIERALLTGLGILTLTREKATRFVDELVKEGAVSPQESRELVDKLVAKGEAEREELRKLIHSEWEKTRASVTPASRRDVEELARKVDELTAKVEALAEKAGPGKKGIS